MRKLWKSDRELQKKLQKEIEVPACVDQKMQEAYQTIGAGEKEMVYRLKKHRKLVGLAAAVGLFAATSMIVVAANYYFSVNLKENEYAKEYQFNVDKTKPAYEIKVEAAYLPEGYELYGTAADYKEKGGKWHNKQTGGAVTIIGYNASEVDALMSSDGESYMMIAKDAKIENKIIQGKNTDIIVQQGHYENTIVKNIFLFDEEEGYAVRIWHEGELSKEELEKVAEGIRVEVTNTEVPYVSEEIKRAEENAAKSQTASEKKARGQGVSKTQVYQVGEEIRNTAPEIIMQEARERGDDEFADYMEESIATERDDILYTVQSAEVRDTLPLSEFPAEYFYNYEGDLLPWLNEDGTLKPHNRIKYSWFGEEAGLTETVKSKFVVVKMKAEAVKLGNRREDTGRYIVPSLTTLTLQPDGNYALPDAMYHSSEKGYSLQYNAGDLASFPIYFDKLYHTEGNARLKSFCYYPIQEGEILEYTVVYVVDEDKIPDMKLWVYETERQTQNGEKDLSAYIDISQ